MEKLVYLLLSLWTAACVCEGKATYDEVAPRIGSGFTAFKSQFPYQATIYYDEKFYCGASIIHKRWILTAAHCRPPKEVKDAYVKVGTIYRNGIDGQKVTIEKFMAHEEFSLIEKNPDQLKFILHDIALIRLGNDIKFNDSIEPIILAKDDREKYENVIATVSGLGCTEITKEGSSLHDPDELQYLHVKVISGAECEKTLATELNIIIFSFNICTSVVNKRSVCKGDSGGPLVFQGKQIGVVSAGAFDFAKSIPNIYTRVSSYIPWINRQLESYSDVLP